MGSRGQWLGILETEVQCRAYLVSADFRLYAARKHSYNDINQHKQNTQCPRVAYFDFRLPAELRLGTAADAVVCGVC